MFIGNQTQRKEKSYDAIEPNVRWGELYILGVCVCLSMSSFRCVPALQANGAPNTTYVNCVETEHLPCLVSCFDFVIDENVAGVS